MKWTILMNSSYNKNFSRLMNRFISKKISLSISFISPLISFFTLLVTQLEPSNINFTNHLFPSVTHIRAPLLLVLLSFVFANYQSCFLTWSTGGIKLNQAAFKTDVAIFGPGVWDLTINICKPVTAQCGSITYAPALWKLFNDPLKCNRIS